MDIFETFMNSHAENPGILGRHIRDELHSHEAPAFIAELATLAAMKSYSAENKAEAFVRNLFAEATDYLLCRDLPGTIGIGNRNNTVLQAQLFRQVVVAEAYTKVSIDNNSAQAFDFVQWSQIIPKLVFQMKRNTN